MKTGRPWVYYLPNLDGRHEALVAACTQKEACALMRVSCYSFRLYGGRRLKDGPRDAGRIAVALSQPERVWLRKIHHGPGAMPWLFREEVRT